jgi:glycosyltransferase involved in cell wall biosynthesis
MTEKPAAATRLPIGCGQGSRPARARVAHVITRLIVGGAQENTIFTAEGLRTTYGYGVTLITGPPLGPEGSLLEAAWRERVPCVVIPQLRRTVNPVRDAIAFARLYTIFRRENYDIVHTHSSKAGILGRLAARLAGVKIVVHTIHGLPFHPYQSRLSNRAYVFLEKVAAKASTKIVCVADAMIEQAVAAGVAPRKKFLTIYSGMDLDAFLESGRFRAATRRRFGIADDEVVIGKIARLFPLKGHEFLFAAAEEVVRRFPKTRFLLVGEGILRERFQRVLRQKGLADRFIFAGLVPPERIPEMISAMDILVHVSLREGLAKALPQAMACGKPVVSFDVDGAREVVKNGGTGYLVRPQDVHGLVDALNRLLPDESLRNRLGASGKRLVDPAFRKERMVEHIHTLYETLRMQSGRQP